MMQTFSMALNSIAGNKFRAFLTMLGIIIGVMALVVLVSLVNGATGSVTDAIENLGTDSISVTISDDKGMPVTLETLKQWMEEDTIGVIAPSGNASVTGKYGTESDSVILYGTTPAYADINGLKLMLGRFLKTSDVRNHTTVCIINETAATELVGYTDCLGEQIALDGVKYTVVGVLEDDEDSLTAVFTSGMKVAYIPYTSLLRLSSTVSSHITSFSVIPAEGADMSAAERTMESLLLKRFDNDEDAFSINTQEILTDTMDQITGVLTILLGGIAAISLIVGGIGIMNIMLVTVTERTREIGIRKAIGAGRGVILQQFLLESVVLCLMGCAIGVFLSWVILRIISMVVASLSLTFQLEWKVVALSVAFCFLIGVIFGLYPANKAAKLPPIEALHYGG